MLKIYRPVKTNRVTQKFGENVPCVRTDANGVPYRPFQVFEPSGGLACPPNSVKFYSAIGMKAHNGVDLLASHGEPIYFPAEALVEWEASTEVDKDGGIGVNVRSKQPIPFDVLPPEAGALARDQWLKNGKKLHVLFRFWHLKGVNVYDRKPVKRGDLIGWADSTGASSGDHLHFAMKFSDTTSWFSLDGNNGYYGAVNHEPYVENIFVGDVGAKPTQFSDKLEATAHVFYSKDKDYGVLLAFARMLRSLGL